ncbi:MAG: hypothetical protein EAZ89_12540 [Bacteroidetes bacterium]|nr:MAG: hypothetical protein EAZ89_12540 [Bacteroidota bacterium]
MNTWRKLADRFDQEPRLSLWAIGIWVALNVIQAIFTELFHDEAYYWMFSQHLAWGYFEHPPMIALMIRTGTLLSDTELGVRLFPILCNALALLLILDMAGPRKRLLLLVLLFSVFEVHIGGFFAAPDAPLSLFATLYFYMLRRYLANDGWANVFLFALVISAMLYSKYHGAMVLFFTICSFPALLTRRSFWLLGITSVVLCLPLLLHLYGQNFGTFAFHLGDRVHKPWSPEFTLNFLGGQILIAGPISGLILLPAAFLYKTKDRWERALKWSLAGVLLFLFAMSFRTWIEANWSASIFVPTLVLAFKYISEYERWERWAWRIALPGIVVLLLFRIHLVVPFVPGLNTLRNEVHGWKEWAHQIEEIAGDEPVLFYNSYAQPSKYTYYTRKLAYPLNNFLYHTTQYEAWGIEDSLQGRPAWYFTTEGGCTSCDTVRTATGKLFYYQRINPFYSYPYLRMDIVSPPAEVVSGQDVELDVQIRSLKGEIRFDRNPEFPVSLVVFVMQKGVWKYYLPAFVDMTPMKIGPEGLVQRIKIPCKMPPGDYEWYVTYSSGWMHPGMVSHFVPFRVIAPSK